MPIAGCEPHIAVGCNWTAKKAVKKSQLGFHWRTETRTLFFTLLGCDPREPLRSDESLRLGHATRYAAA